eukprot:602108-Alexandrium_andersonii.AAC.1
MKPSLPNLPRRWAGTAGSQSRGRFIWKPNKVGSKRKGAHAYPSSSKACRTTSSGLASPAPGAEALVATTRHPRDKPPQQSTSMKRFEDSLQDTPT